MQYRQNQLPTAYTLATVIVSPIWIAMFTVMCLLLSSQARAQVMIKGKVFSKTDDTPLLFSTIAVKNSKKGVLSDTAGNFSLSVQKLPAKLTFSAIGFESREIIVKDSTLFLVVKLKESFSALTEVVVTGYSSSGDFDAAYAPSVSKSLKGKVSGVRVTPGTTRSIKIRGAATTSAAEPLHKTESKKPVAGSAGNTEKRTSLLTAGEVNDFKKWTMWEDYNETSFKAHCEKWNLFATQRYSVQLQNENFRAITGQTLYLLNKTTGDTLWTAVSDNTGKAELWKGFSGTNRENDIAIAVNGQSKLFSAIPFAQGVNRITVNKNCSVSNTVDIAFVVDATGSMQDEIDYLKEELGDILTKISLKDPSLDLRTGAVFYRDQEDEYVTRIKELSGGISGTINFIRNQVAGGGGDYPEAVEQALHAAIEQLQWSSTARTKIMFLLMDAPPHDEANTAMATLIQDAAAKGIRIVPVACSGTDKATEFIMRSMALATNGTYLFLTDDSGIGNSHIKPTTDEFKVELLNDLIQRIIEQMCFTNSCDTATGSVEPLTSFTNTEKVKVFPNPTAGPVTVETTKELKEIFITDFTGKIVARLEVKDRKGKYNIDLSGFPSATYLIRYLTKQNTTGAEKITLIR